MDAFLRSFLLALLAVAPAASRAQDSIPPLNARAVDLCEPPSACEHIGKLRLPGALDLPSRTVNGMRFSGLSGLAWNDDDNLLYALSDHGVLFSLRPIIRNGQLVDITLLHAAPLIDPGTRKPVKWRRSDAEGLDILNGRNGRKGDAELIVGFEGEPRIARYRPDGQFIADVPLFGPLRNIRNYHYNKMLEAVCMHPREGVLTAPEEPLNGDEPGDGRGSPRRERAVETGTARLYRADGSAWRFTPGRGGIVALECLPDGDVLVMERDYSTLTLRWIITLRRLRLPAGTPPDTLLADESVTLLDSRQGLHIDNFEGLARHHGNRYFMVSDDNDVFVQHTLLVYFELADPGPQNK
jgi:hypothetical protein